MTLTWPDFQTTVARVYGIPLSDTMRASLEAFYTLLLSANVTQNLTRITALPDFLTHHLADSLSLAPVLAACRPDFTVMDIGSGAGFPAIPLAIAYPQARITAVESVQKKARFIQHAADALKLANLSVLATRCESLARQPDYREAFEVVTARAVAALPVLAEWCLPLVQPGGRWIAMKTAQGVETELPLARDILSKLGGGAPDLLPVAYPGLEQRRLLSVVKKQPTPNVYPRSPGQIRKSYAFASQSRGSASTARSE